MVKTLNDYPLFMKCEIEGVGKNRCCGQILPRESFPIRYRKRKNGDVAVIVGKRCIACENKRKKENKHLAKTKQERIKKSTNVLWSEFLGVKHEAV